METAIVLEKICSKMQDNNTHTIFLYIQGTDAENFKASKMFKTIVVYCPILLFLIHQFSSNVFTAFIHTLHIFKISCTCSLQPDAH